MKIEIKSWEMTDSSLTRRRKRLPKEKSLPVVEPVIAHSFVCSQRMRPHKKSRSVGLEDELIPLLVLTSETKVVVAGILRGKFTVSQNRQYPCHPGASFLPTNGTDATPVSAVLEGRLDLMYGLQNQNKRLVCWSSVSDSLENTVSKTLDGRALSLGVMPSRFPMVYGTLEGETTISLFLASYDQGERNIEIQTFDVPDLSSKSEILQHVATHGHVQEASSDRASTGKRKEACKDDNLTVIQVFASASTLYIARHNIYCGANSDVSSFAQTAVAVHEVPLERLHLQGQVTVNVVGIQNDNILLSYRTSSGSHYLVSLSSTDGRVVNGPYDVGSNMREVSMVDARLVMAVMDNGIGLIDLLSGSVLQKARIPADIGSQNWSLLGLDSRRSRVCVLVEKESGYAVASATFISDFRAASPPSCLAERLSQSLDASTGLEYQGTALFRQRFDEGGAGDYSYSAMHSIKTSIEMIEMAYAALEEGRYNDEIVASVFTGAVETMVLAEDHVGGSRSGRSIDDEEDDEDDENPQDCHPYCKLSSSKNGLHGESRSVSTSGKSAKHSRTNRLEDTVLNELQIGRNLRKISPSLVTFIGISAIRFLTQDRDLGRSRNVIRSILRKAVRSRRVSARHLFGNQAAHSFSLALKSLQRKNSENTSSYSPVELLFDVLSHCKDVSERHMVCGARYMLLHATADDITDYFERTHPLSSSNRYRKLCDEFRKVKSESNIAEDPAVEKLSNKLALRVSEAYLGAILTYSDYNETLLRRAVAENLKRGEVVLFLKLMSQVRRVAETRNFNGSVLQRAFLWTSALCECLTVPSSKEEMGLLNEIKLSVTTERNATKALLSIRDTLESMMANASEAEKADSVPDAKRSPTQLPAYQMERLIF